MFKCMKKIYNKGPIGKSVSVQLFYHEELYTFSKLLILFNLVGLFVPLIQGYHQPVHSCRANFQ